MTEAKQYPDDWFCKICARQFYQHVKIGTPNEDNNANFPARVNYCFFNKDSVRTPQYYWVFIPVDNLTQIEILARQKAII
jgi:hypothetical protein